MNRIAVRSLQSAVAGVVAVTLIGCGSEATVTEAAGGGEPVDAAACEDRLAVLVDQLRVDVAYDYQPSSSPADLAAIVDAVVTATLGDLSQEGENVSAALEDVEVITGDTSKGSDGDLTVSWYVSPEPRELGETDGISVLAFLSYAGNLPTPEIEGLWFACGPDAPARSMIVEPVEAGWPAGPDATLANLALAVTDPDTAAATATETFTVGALTCYHDLTEDSIADFAADAIGADTPQDAVDIWWSNGGRFRNDRDTLDEELDVPEARYRDDRGNVQLALGLVELPAGGWVVETTQACVTP